MVAKRAASGRCRWCCWESRRGYGAAAAPLARDRSRPVPLEDFFTRALGRIRLRDALRAAAAGAIAMAIAIAIVRSRARGFEIPAAIAAFIVIGLATFMSFARDRHRRAAVAAVERANPSLRNLLVTAEQLIADPNFTSPYMRERVIADATRQAARIDLPRSVPLTREITALAGAIALVVVASVVRTPALSIRAGTTQSPQQTVKQSAAASVVLELVPPTYSRQAPSRLTDPSRIDVLAGTRATLRVSNPEGGEVRLNEVRIPLAGDGTAGMMLTTSGFIAVQARGLNRLIPLTVLPDRLPEVRIPAPGKDLRVATVSAPIPITAEAADDLGLASLALRYTVVSGTGEQFSFTEGTLPATVTRQSDRSWTMKAALSLAQLKLEPGDSLIYRAVAVDGRPGGDGLASSDTFFVELAGPGDVPLEGVEMPPDKERYALSQAMIVLKIERLQARERSLSKEALIEAAGNIAAEQRAVRANFIFLLGGEIEDEEVEAETSHEISEGRLVNQARGEIVNATLLMGRVERALSAPSTRDALPPARDAVKALQRAFGHSRYLLRALPSRARIDPSRRLSGDLASALDWSRLLAPVAPDADAEMARAALAELAEVNAALGDTAQRTETTSLLARIAERLLSGSRNADLQAAARDVIAARDSLTANHSDAATDALRRAAAPLVRQAQRGRIDAESISPAAARLAGAAASAEGRKR